MIEIRIHGRGGQGSVTMAQMLAQAAFEDGKWAQGFPHFGIERRGAPVLAFTRIDENKITDRSQVINPDHVIVQDSSLLAVVDVLGGLKEGGLVLMNTRLNPEEVDLDVERLQTIDATGIAMEQLGRPIMNTALMGAFSAATDLISLKSIKKVIRRRFRGEVAEKNVSAAKTAYERLKQK